jgi:hypothetical protein
MWTGSLQKYFLLVLIKPCFFRYVITVFKPFFIYLKYIIFYNVCIIGLGTYLRALAQPTSSCYCVTRAFQRRSMSALPLISDPKYAFLKDELALKEENNGVFDGTWFASGDVSLQWKRE